MGEEGSYEKMECATSGYIQREKCRHSGTHTQVEKVWLKYEMFPTVGKRGCVMWYNGNGRDDCDWIRRTRFGVCK